MSCEHCVKAVTKALSQIPELSLKSVQICEAVAEVNNLSDWSKIKKAIENEGYEVIDIKVFNESR